MWLTYAMATACSTSALPSSRQIAWSWCLPLRPQYQATTTSYKGQYLESAYEVAVGPDGTVYATMGPSSSPNRPATLDRLAPGSDQWQSLGPLPQGQYATAELPGAGIFWIGGGWLYNA
jgi:hypothetical protein